jgi:hypothetical protein
MTHDDRVRVLDTDPRSSGEVSGPPEPGRRELWLLLGFAALMVMGLWLTSGSSGEPADAAASVETAAPPLGSATAVVPDLTGLTTGEAVAALAEAGLPVGEALRSRWIASVAAEPGFIVDQDPPAGAEVDPTGRVTVVVSAGGPVVQLRQLPAHVQELARSLPGFDPAEPILATETAAGTAYKTDRWLFGDCEAVELAYRGYPDPSYGEDCVVYRATTVSGVLPDGTRYVIGGVPEGIYAPIDASGGLVYDGPAGALPLGPTEYERLPEAVPTAVRYEDGALVMQTGTWSIRVSASPRVLADLGEGAAGVLVAAVRPVEVEGFVTFEMAPPLRLQRAGELPSRIAVEYGAFRVVHDCVTGVINVVCDPGGRVSVEGSESGFDVSQVSVEVEVAAPAG